MLIFFSKGLSEKQSQRHFGQTMCQQLKEIDYSRTNKVIDFGQFIKCSHSLLFITGSSKEECSPKSAPFSCFWDQFSSNYCSLTKSIFIFWLCQHKKIWWRHYACPSFLIINAGLSSQLLFLLLDNEMKPLVLRFQEPFLCLNIWFSTNITLLPSINISVQCSMHAFKSKSDIVVISPVLIAE